MSVYSFPLNLKENRLSTKKLTQHNIMLTITSRVAGFFFLYLFVSLFVSFFLSLSFLL